MTSQHYIPATTPVIGPAPEEVAIQGLDDEEASRILVECIENLLVNHTKAIKQQQRRWELKSIQLAVSTAYSLCIGTVFICYFFVFLPVRPYDEWGYLVAGIFILLAQVLNNFLVHHRQGLAEAEITTRLRLFCNQVKVGGGIDYNMDINIPEAHTISLTRVRRNGLLKKIPNSLLVEGDVVELMAGDKAPGKLVGLFMDVQVARGQSFSPSSSQQLGNVKEGERQKFVLMETPVLKHLQATLSAKRSEPAYEKEHISITSLVLFYAIPLVAFVSLITGLIRYFTSIPSLHSSRLAFELLAVNVSLCVLPLIPLTFAVLRLYMIDFANARVISLFDELQSSKRDFEEEDEFDQDAPPPVKDVEVSLRDIWEIFWNNLFSVDVRNLSRSTYLFESMADMSVLSAIDREGTLSTTYPITEQFIFADKEENLVALDVTEEQEKEFGVLFEDADWKSHVSSIRPLCLNLALNAVCVLQNGKRRIDHHRTANSLLEIGAHRARQTCQCRYASEVGFTVETSYFFTKKRQVVVLAGEGDVKKKRNCPNHEIPCALTCLWKDSNGEQHLLTDGTSELVLSLCSDYWAGNHLSELDEAMTDKWLDLLENADTNDIYCLALAYRPFTGQDFDFKGSVVRVGDENFGKINKQIFLGVVTLVSNPKEDVCDFIADLNTAGIRFTFFSPYAERESKAFANRLGLETDWNSCILLSDDTESDGTGYLEVHDIKAKLPRGTAEIRKHLAEVDDIPLLVSLFADCSAAAVREMINIFQDYGETVCAFGSILNPVNMVTFAEADMSVGAEPFRTKLLRQPISNPTKLNSIRGGAYLTSIACSLILQYDASHFVLLQAAADARRLLTCFRQCVYFLVSCYTCVTLTELATGWAHLPPIFSAYQLLWLTCVVCPAIGFSFLGHVQEDDDVMKLMPSKKLASLDYSRKTRWFFGYVLFRSSSLTVTLVILYMLILQYSGNPFKVLGFGICSRELINCDINPKFPNALTQLQHLMLLVFVYNIVWMSASFISRHSHVYSTPTPLNTRSWIIAVVITFTLTLGFTLPFLKLSFLAMIPWPIYVAALLSPVLHIPFQTIAKNHDKKIYIRAQKRAKLEFNTKLGQYSPV